MSLLWMRTSSMYVRTLGRPLMVMSMSLAKDAGQPVRPMGLVVHWNWPMPGTVKAV